MCEHTCDSFHEISEFSPIPEGGPVQYGHMAVQAREDIYKVWLLQIPRYIMPRAKGTLVCKRRQNYGRPVFNR